MARLRFHHLVVETRTSLAVDPALQLLTGLPPAGDAPPADVVVGTRPASAPAPDRGWSVQASGELAPTLAGPPAFVHSDIEVRLGADAVELAWPRARFTVTAGPPARAEGLVEAALLDTPLGRHAVAQGPTLMALAVALRALGVFHLHAGCAVLDGRAVLVPGLAGAGKSTLTTALLAAGADYLGDDTVFAARRGAEDRLLAHPREFHLAPRSAAPFGLEAALDPGHETLGGKRRLDAAAAFPGRFLWDAPAPAVVLLPRITGEPATRLVPGAGAEALGALLESSLLAPTRGLPGGEGHLPLLARLADGATVLRAELGLDLLEDGRAVAGRIAAAVEAALAAR